MCKLARVCLLVALIFCGAPAFAMDSKVVQGSSAPPMFHLNKEHIDITAGFIGETLNIYGGLDQDGGDVLFVVTGPLRHIKVMRREKTMGGWMPGKEVVFKNIPSFYRIAASDGLSLQNVDEFLGQQKIGGEHFDFLGATGDKQVKGDAIKDFRQAVLQNQYDKHLYNQGLDKIAFLNPHLFMVSFDFPHNVPVGTYQVDAYLFEKGVEKKHQEAMFTVGQVGSGHVVNQMLKKHSFLYGVTCVFLAIAAGWLSNRLRRAL